VLPQIEAARRKGLTTLRAIAALKRKRESQ